MDFQFTVLTFLATLIAASDANPTCHTRLSAKCKMTNPSGMSIDCNHKNLHSTEVCTICDQCKDVESLYLNDIGVSGIPDFCFRHCRRMKVLSLAFNNISSFPKLAFQGLTNLKSLNLDNNRLIHSGGVQDADVFRPLPNLEVLFMRQNTNDMAMNESEKTYYLSNISKTSLKSLKYLYLDGLPNTEFGKNFRSLRNLTLLDFSGHMSDCNIRTLTNASFSNVPFITSLNLSNCNLSTVDAGAFKPLTELRVLDLSSNMALGFRNLRNVSYGLQFTRIDVLDYSRVYKTFGLSTQVNRCDVWFLQNTTLREIRLSRNRITSFEINALSLLPLSLEVAFVDDNRLSFGPYVLQVGCVENLQKLELNRQNFDHNMNDYNHEVSIQEDREHVCEPGGCVVTKTVTENCHLLSSRQKLLMEEVSLPRNLKSVSFRSSHLRYYLSVLKFPLPIKTKLHSLDVSHNVLYKWDGVFFRIDSLRLLNLSNNFCSYVSGNFFRNFPYMEELDASFNKLGPHLALDVNGSSFNHLQRLRDLNLSNNWIEQLPKNIFIETGSIESLDLSFNHLGKLDFRLIHMKNLSNLNLRENKISTLPLEVLQLLAKNAATNERNATIDLTGNALDVSCDNKEFGSWMIEHSNYFVNIENYIFFRGVHGPIRYTDFVNGFSVFQKYCHRYTAVIIISVCFIISFISIIIGGIIYRYRWRLRYFYYMIKARYHGYIPVRDTEVRGEYKHDIFISYATENYRFVTTDMYRRFEEAGLQMCLHQKDFLPGHDIAENIIHAVRNSRITLVVLSPAFLESQWCIYEFNMARMEGIYSRGGKNVIFIVMYEDIDIARASQEIRECLESESYLSFPNEEAERPYFWQMLLQAMLGKLE